MLRVSFVTLMNYEIARLNDEVGQASSGKPSSQRFNVFPLAVSPLAEPCAWRNTAKDK